MEIKEHFKELSILEIKIISFIKKSIQEIKILTLIIELFELFELFKNDNEYLKII